MGKPYAQVYQARLRAEMIGVENTLTIDEWLRVIADSGGKCCYCGKQLEPHKVEIEHRIPITQGGPNTKENVSVACRECNKSKGAHGPNGEKPKVGRIENYKGHWLYRAGCLVEARDLDGITYYPYFPSLQEAKDFLDYRITSGDEELELEKKWNDAYRWARKQEREERLIAQKKGLDKIRNM